jgi:sugar phosphate isomerase/epimerase
LNAVAVSSFCFVSRLGPIRFESRGPDGDLTITTLPIPRAHSLEEWAGLVRSRYDVDAIEICQIQIDDPSADRIDALRRSLDDSGVTVRTVPIDFGELDSPDKVRRDVDVEHLLAWFDIAERLGSEYVRVNAGSPMDASSEPDHHGTFEALRTLSGEAERRGMRLLVENHGGPSSDPGYLLELLDQVDGIGLLLDLGNFEPLMTVSRARFNGESPATDHLQVEHVYDHIERLAPVAELVHVKAFDPRDDGSPLLDVDRALSTVQQAGYAGPYTIEWEGHRTDPWDATGDLIRRVRSSATVR